MQRNGVYSKWVTGVIMGILIIRLRVCALLITLGGNDYLVRDLEKNKKK